MILFFPLRFGRKKVVVIGLVVAAIANLLVTVIPDDRDNAGDALEMVYAQYLLLFVVSPGFLLGKNVV